MNILQHTGHKTTKRFFDDGSRRFFVITETKPKSCKACILEEKIEANAQKKRLEQQLNISEPLLCDKCQTQIGYVDAGDLEGSQFFCITCKKQYE